jgi:hypothetical protein
MADEPAFRAPRRETRAQAARLYDLLERTARLLPMRDAALFTSTSRWPSSFRDALCRGCDGALIPVVELEGAGIRSDALRGRLPMLKVAQPDEHGEAVGPRGPFAI